MILKSLSLTDFKNIESAQLEFSPKINCFLGDNGMGKSNLLDSLYYISLCRSFTGAPDQMLVRRDAQFATIRGAFERKGLDEDVSIAIRPGQRKIIRRSGKPYKRLAEHLGVFPVVLLSPADMDLSAGEPAERRRFIDQIIAQRDNRYYDSLMRYNSALEQRNKMLRDESDDNALYEILEMQLESAAEYICNSRRENIAELQAIFEPYFNTISNCEEIAGLTYESAPYNTGGLAEHLSQTRYRDKILHHTSAGPHRDDIAFTINGMPVRRSASQGQTKTFTTALRFAQYELLRKSLGIRPLLLLDDIYDKLDAGRVERIIKLVSTSDTFGQIFITDTNRRHLDETVASIPSGGDYSIWSVDCGSFDPIAR